MAFKKLSEESVATMIVEDYVAAEAKLQELQSMLECEGKKAEGRYPGVQNAIARLRAGLEVYHFLFKGAGGTPRFGDIPLLGKMKELIMKAKKGKK